MGQVDLLAQRFCSGGGPPPAGVVVPIGGVDGEGTGRAWYIPQGDTCGSSDASSYESVRNGMSIATTGGDRRSFTCTGLEPGTHTFTIRARNAGGSSDAPGVSIPIPQPHERSADENAARATPE
jgi:hypothetical protein